MMQTKTKNTAKSSMLLSVIALVSALLLLVLLFLGGQTIAWFKSFLKIENDAQLTNFAVGVSYSFDNGTSWTGIDDGVPIPVTLDNVSALQIAVSYQGESAAYLRTSLHGGFVNANTGTALPQSEDFWSFELQENSTVWTVDGDYCYYTARLQDHSTEKVLETFSVGIDTASLGTISDKQAYTGELYVIVDAVQPDRYPVFWGIDQLPF